MLITDAMQAAGMPDGNYTLCGERVEMRNGIVRTLSGSPAGSTLSLDSAVRTISSLPGMTAERAIHMASLHPARLLGAGSAIRIVTAGKKMADMIAVDNELRVEKHLDPRRSVFRFKSTYLFWSAAYLQTFLFLSF